MNIVWLAPLVPYPPRDGGSIRLYHLIKGLARRHSIHLLSLEDRPVDEDALVELRKVCAAVEVFQHAVRPPRWSLSWFRAQSTRLWNPLSTYYRPALASRLKALLLRGGVDLVLFETLKMAAYGLRDAAKTTPPAFVLSRQNYEPDAIWSMIRSTPMSLGTALWWWTAWSLERQERRMVRQFKHVTAASEQDAARFRSVAPRTQVVVVPNGVEVDRFRHPHIDDGRTVMLMASMRYAPNLDSARYFSRCIWPLIRSRCEDARLVVIGDQARAALGAELGSGPGTDVVEPSRDIAQELARATVMVVPLRAGAGTRIKILEALAAEKPVVSTTIGCQGLDVAAGRHLIVADRPREFADQVVALLENPQRRRRLGIEGAALVRDRYRWDTAVNALNTLCQQVAANVVVHAADPPPARVRAVGESR